MTTARIWLLVALAGVGLGITPLVGAPAASNPASHFSPEAIAGCPLLQRLLKQSDHEGEKTLLAALIKAGMAPRMEQFSYAPLYGKRKVVLFVRNSSGWPGNNSQIIALTDEEDEVLAWKEVGGEPTFVAAELARNPMNPILEICCLHRPSMDWSMGIYRYSLQSDQITLLPGSEKLDRGGPLPAR